MIPPGDRRIAVAVPALLLATPVAVLFLRHFSLEASFNAHSAFSGYARLLFTTLALLGLVTCVSLPVGSLLGTLLARSPIRGRRTLSSAWLAGLFIPLPVWAVAGQIVLGEWLPPLAIEPGAVAWRPWQTGLFPAALIHAAAGIPWIVLLVRIVLETTDPNLVEAARSTAGELGVRRWVHWPRLRASLIPGFGILAWQVGTEIAVTDAMMVRTVAEDVYTQMVVRSTGLSGTLATSVPMWLASTVVAAWVGSKWWSRFRATSGERIVDLKSNSNGLLRTIASWAGIVVFLGLPMAALVWKAAGGQNGALGDFLGRMEKIVRAEWTVWLDSSLSALVAGVLLSLLARWCAALALRSKGYGQMLIGLNLLLFALPAPIAGFAVKETILALVVGEKHLLDFLSVDAEFPPLRSLLYDQPSPLPGLWVGALRFFPFACAGQALALRRIPDSLIDAARLEGLGFRSLWLWVVAPGTRWSTAALAIALAALDFGEVGGGKLAQPPARGVFVLRIFDQMHYGAESTVAGMCLLQSLSTWGILWLLVGIKSERTP